MQTENALNFDTVRFAFFIKKRNILTPFKFSIDRGTVRYRHSPKLGPTVKLIETQKRHFF